MKPGIYKIPEEDYHKDPCPKASLSRSIIKDLLFDCPYRAWLNHPRLNPDWQPEEENTKFDIGTSAHQIFLEGIDKVKVIDFDDWRKKEAKEQREQARADGLIPLLKGQYDGVMQMAVSVEKHIKDYTDIDLENGETEQTAIWEENGIWCRVRPDWLSDDRKTIIDYKTTGLSANPELIDRHIVNMGYDIQHAFYSHVVEKVTGIKPNFFFIFQETTPPYLCSPLVSLNTDFEKMARQKVEYGMFLWEKCLRENKWPAYPKEIAYVDAPGWAVAHWEQIAANIY